MFGLFKNSALNSARKALKDAEHFLERNAPDSSIRIEYQAAAAAYINGNLNFLSLPSLFDMPLTDEPNVSFSEFRKWSHSEILQYSSFSISSGEVGYFQHAMACAFAGILAMPAGLEGRFELWIRFVKDMGLFDLINDLEDDNEIAINPSQYKDYPTLGLFGRGFLEAVEDGDLETVREMLEQSRIKGIPANEFKGIQLEALQTAADLGYTAIVEFFQNQGLPSQDQKNGAPDFRSELGHSDASAYDDYSEDDLYTAAENGDKDMVKLLLDKEVDAGRALIPAAANGYIEIAELLLDHGADVNDGDFLLGLITPLSAASMEGQAEMVAFLLDHGANVNERCNLPLCEAAKRGHTDVVRILLDHGADIDAGADYDNPLCLAVMEGKIDTVNELIDRGANIEINTSFGTPLCLAACRGQTAIARILLIHGASVEAVTEKGTTALQIAESRKNKELKELIIKWASFAG